MVNKRLRELSSSRNEFERAKGIYTVAHKCHGKTYFLTAKHTFSRQNLLSHGKTYFLTAKLTFSRQNLLSHGKTYFLTSKLGYQTVIRRNYHDKSLLNSRIKDLNLKRKRCAQRNCMTMFIEYDIENDQADGDQRNHVV